MNSRKYTHRYLIAKLLKTKNKDKILKATKEKWFMAYKEMAIRLTADFLSETIGAKRE